MLALLYTVHVAVCLFLILVVLLQQGKGADLSVFGGGATQAAFGARGAATLLHKLTVFGFVAYILTTVTIGLATSGASAGSSVMSDAAAVTESVPATEPEANAPAPPRADGAAAGDAETGAPESAPRQPDGGSSQP